MRLGGVRSFCVRQCMSSVLGTEKERPSFDAWRLSFLNLACNSWILRRWEDETDVSARSSTKEMVLADEVPLWRGAMYRTNRRGEIGDPYGVPTATFTKEFGAPWKRRRQDLSERNALTHETM